MAERLIGKRVAIFVEDLFEDSELLEPMHFLKAEGAEVVIIGPGRANQFRGKNGTLIEVDRNADDVAPCEFDAYIVPGGYAPGKMRRSSAMIQIIADADDCGKVVAAVCHGPQLLISADVLRGRMATGLDTIAVDMKNAGAQYLDEAVVVDGNVITSRTPADLPDFNQAIFDALVSNGVTGRQSMVAGA